MMTSASTSCASTSSTSSDSNVLDYEMAMSQFISMFPNIKPLVIEKILRSHNGDVTNTINDLLCHSADSSTPSQMCDSRSRAASASSTLSTNNFYAGELTPDEKEKQNTNAARLNSNGSSHAGRSEGSTCVDDEKIALLMQNREFLEYLKNDARFMREIAPQSSSSQYNPNSYRQYRGRSYSSTTNPPTRDGMWRVCAPPTGYYYNNKYYTYNATNNDTNCRRLYDTPYCSDASELAARFEKEIPEALPDGPLVNFASGNIPKGPLIDYSSNQPSSSVKNWSQKVKSHLPLVGKSLKHNNSQLNDKDFVEEAPYVFNGKINDENFPQRLRNMSKSSKEMFLTLAKRFAHTKKNNAQVPVPVSDDEQIEHFDNVEHSIDKNIYNSEKPKQY